MQHRRTSSNTSTGSTGYSIFETSSVSSSPPNSSTTSSYYSNSLLTVQAPTKVANTNTFVHKLYNMVLDDQFQHLISWSYTGTSFIVCNILDFSKDVLPKHFKHNNFSSFVRQLNMYGFHKVNKSPRGHRTMAENQIWEFSHTKFLRGRPDLLDEIKRKAMETTDNQQRQVNGDLQAHMNLIQSSQSDMMQQLTSLFENFNHVVKELGDTKRKQESQDILLRNMMQYICQQNNGQVPTELNLESMKNEKETPSIFVTSHQPPYHHHISSTGSRSLDNSGLLNIHDLPMTPNTSRSPHILNNYIPTTHSGHNTVGDDLNLNRNHRVQQHRRHVSAGTIPTIHTSLSSSPFGHSTLQPILTPHSNDGAFDFINPHDPLSH
ncbi:HSF-type DNA-binding-domain-containing protein [Chlamydoabsidia padenii]|nr:HSF-type DNA-binding-domain-containing protein [Chlamydoabsidia padenii]